MIQPSSLITVSNTQSLSSKVLTTEDQYMTDQGCCPPSQRIERSNKEPMKAMLTTSIILALNNK